MGVGGKFFLPCATLGVYFYRECRPPGLSLLPPSSVHNQGLYSEPLWSDILPGTPRGRVSMRAGGKFSPFVRLVSLIFAGSVAPGLDTPAFPSGMQLETFVLPFRDQASSLVPSGVAYLLGVGGKFLTSLRYLWSVFYRECQSPGLSLLPPLSGHNQGP